MPGKFYAYQEAIKGSRDFQFYIKTLDGLYLKKFAFSRFYANGADLSAFYKKELKIHPLVSIFKGKRDKLIAVMGRGLADYETVTIIAFENGKFRIVPKLDEYGGLENTFNANEVTIKNLDDDPEEELIENNSIRYINADDQIWRDYYDLDKETGIYKFIKQEKISISMQKFYLSAI